jgi:hypothetical protein
MQMLESTISPQNHALQEDFSLSPARGVFPGEGTESFNFSYFPQNLNQSSFRAVLMLKNVPLGAYPAAAQHEELIRLGLGLRLRLRLELVIRVGCSG